jgi:hypothetical protein
LANNTQGGFARVFNFRNQSTFWLTRNGREMALLWRKEYPQYSA